ncbi:MAG TPA: UbiA family prenyltransferase, partial [Polyangiales bacterium]|nr:UbiA family prenyltransferase [Polyangiales bacterium]
MRFRPLLRLCRVPNVFTAFADAVAGIALARGAFQVRDLSLVFASGSLYLAGMVWNDYFDREVDARERPERPIPSGEVSPLMAAGLGVGLAALGLGLALAHGLASFAIALALVLAILAYDVWLKNGALGPAAMGVCRTLDVVLGLSAALPTHAWPYALPCLLGLFTLLITRLSRFEVFGANPTTLRGTLFGFVLWFLLLVAALIWVSVAAAGGGASWWAAPLVLYLIVRERRLLSPLRTQVTPPLLGRAIGGGIML